MKTISFQIDGMDLCCARPSDGKTTCISAFVFCGFKVIIVDKDHTCPRCGYWYGSHDARCAVNQIADFLKN